MTTILIKKKDTAGAPAAGDLTNAAGGTEIAVNTATKRIYSKDSGGNVIELGTNPSGTTMAGNLLFSPDNTYDIGASGATRARTLYLGTSLITPAITNTGLTSGRVVYSTTGGLETDSANLTFDGTNFATTGTATAAKLIPTGSSATGNGLYLPAANSVGLSTNGTNAVYIDSTQNVGIGTSSPTAGYKLNIADTTAKTQITSTTGTNLAWSLWTNTGGSIIAGIESSAGGSIFSGTGAYSAVFGHSGGYPVAFATSNTERMRIDSSGNVGIGTSSPVGKLDVVSVAQDQVSVRSNNSTAGASILVSSGDGTTSNNYSYIQYQNKQTSQQNWKVGTFGSSAFSFYDATASAERMRIDSSGNVGIGTSSPSTYGRFVVSGSGNSGVGTFIGNASLTGSAPTYQGSIRLLDNPTSSTAASGGIEFLTSTFGSGYGFKIASVDSSGVSLTFATRQNSASWTEAMRIDNAGNVGIGTSSPTAILHVKSPATGANASAIIENAGSTATALLYFKNSAARQMLIGYTGQSYSGGEYGTIDVIGAYPLVFATNDIERMRIDSSGNLLVGTTTTSNTNGVVITKGGAAGGGIIQLSKTASGATNGTLNYYGTTYVGGINYDNTSTSLATSSDIRLKKDVVDAPSAINVTTSIRVVSHGWKHDEATVRYGFVAQELINVAPEAVMQGDDGEEIEKTWTVDYARLVPMLVKTIQEQQALITTLTARITALEST
jgi:hypothetical protein